MTWHRGELPLVTRHRWELPLPASLVALGNHWSYTSIACCLIRRHLTCMFPTMVILAKFKHASAVWALCGASACSVQYILQPVVSGTRWSSLEVRFGDHPVDFIDALPNGGFNWILVDLVDFAGRLLGACLGRLPPEGLWLVGRTCLLV